MRRWNLIREDYLDFGPTLAREKLIELHQISVAKERLRQWMTEAGIWVSRRESKKRVFQPRGQRPSLAPSPARFASANQSYRGLARAPHGREIQIQYF
ncbi:hypothetical protein ATY29_27175 [Rhizobium hidalgonense]|nr:hypothetical protein ATY29_27175 [Rhizobium hidalgonense]